MRKGDRGRGGTGYGGREGGKGEEKGRKGEGNLAPRSFVKVGAYGLYHPRPSRRYGGRS